MSEDQFFSELDKYFKEKDLYKIYDVNRKCTIAEIKKAYKRLSLLFHPDRNDESLKEESKIKFQLVSKIHLILSDKDKRKLYDDNGIIDDSDFNNDNFNNWEIYWRNLYPKITVNQITNFEKKYKNSAEEKEDLKKFYLKFKGNLSKIMDNVMFAEVSDEDRYKTIINSLIESNEVPPYDAFLKESQASIRKRKRNAEKENKEWENLQNSESFDLVSSIQNSQKSRQSQNDQFLDGLLKKYAPKSSKQKKSK